MCMNTRTSMREQKTNQSKKNCIRETKISRNIKYINYIKYIKCKIYNQINQYMNYGNYTYNKIKT